MAATALLGAAAFAVALLFVVLTLWTQDGKWGSSESASEAVSPRADDTYLSGVHHLQRMRRRMRSEPDVSAQKRGKQVRARLPHPLRPFAHGDASCAALLALSYL